MITLLDQNTINKIAAGEVVERPSAVVKELVENAIDAGANSVTVEIKEGGISFIRITDNGGGIKKEEISLAFKRHSTSKIKSVEDLMTVKSLGFRGEALASIAAVSQVELVTKTPGALTGSRFIIEGGEEKELEEIGCPEGTTFLIRNLFYNTPARRKFLKSSMTEAGYVGDLIERLAISHPEVSFKFINNNQVKLQTAGNRNLKDIIYHVYGRDIASHVLPIVFEKNDIKISGFIGKPTVSRGNRNYMNYFINGRYIKSAIINRAIEEAYKPYTMAHRYPFIVLNFEMDSQLIDINVHPTKMEVRFSNQEEIFRYAYDCVSDGLRQKELIPEVSLVSAKRAPQANEKKESSPVEQSKLHGPEPFEKRRKEEDQLLNPNKGIADHAQESNHQFVQKDTQKIYPSSNSVFIQDRKQNSLHNNPDINLLFTENNKPNVNPASASEFVQDSMDHDSMIHDNMVQSSMVHDNMVQSSMVQSNMIQSNMIQAGTQENILNGNSSDDLKFIKGNEQNASQANASKITPANRLNEESAGDYDITHGTKLAINSNFSSELMQDDNWKVTKEVTEITSERYADTLIREAFHYSPNTQNKDSQATSLFSEKATQIELGFLNEESKKNHRIIGQLFATYWLVEYQEKLFIIDQHAAHEKVLYEKTMKSLKQKEFLSQMLSPPLILTLNMSEEEVLLKNMNIFAELGFEIEHFGGKEYAVSGVPADLFNIAQKDLLVELLDSLVSMDGRNTPDILLEKVASMSCKAAVKGNMRLSLQEAADLIDQLLELENPYHCPHGRPTIISMTKYELEKKFKRII